LTEELTAELAGILSWSLDGLDRLTRQGKFTELKSSSDSILALQDFVSPVAAFVRDRCRSALVTGSRLRTFRRLALVVRGQRTQAGVGPDLRT
jgi:phage/plasmid-associated DNA primase